MTKQSDLHYFTRRNRQEAELAERCYEPSARRAHQQLAELHRKKAREALMETMHTAPPPHKDSGAA